MGRACCVVLLILAACDVPAPATRIGTDSAPIVESIESLWGSVRRLESEPLLAIGAESGGGPDMFAGLSNARFLSSGRIGVGDSQADRIQVFDSLGNHVATLGRPGEGPGEFRDLGRIYPHPGDSVAGFDFGLSRTVVFALDQSDSRAVSGLQFDGRAPVLGVLGTGSFLAYQNLPPVRVAPGEGWDSVRVILVPPDGQVPIDVAHLPLTEARGGPGSPQRVLGARSVMAASEDGFYWARSDRYEILQFDSLGTVRQVIRRPVEPLDVTAADERDYRDGTLAGARETGGEQAAQSVARQLQDASFASTRPLFGSAFVDRDARLWVSDLPWPSRYVAPRRWSVFSSDGKWLGDVEPPEGLQLEDASGDRVLGIWRSDLGVGYVRVHRLLDPI